MSSRRSDWRERLHANPSRMEQEIAIKLQDNRITNRGWTLIRGPSTSLCRGTEIEFGSTPRYARVSLKFRGILLPTWTWHCWARPMSCQGLVAGGSVTSEVVGCGWTHMTFLRTVGAGSPRLASLTPLSGGGSGPSRVLFFVILSPLEVFSERGSCVSQPLPWA